MRSALLLASAALLSGCAVHYSGKPFAADMGQPDAVCIAEAKGVREEFLRALQDQLAARRIATKVIAGTSPVDACPFVLTYTATWHWDIVMYMREARMFLYHRGAPVSTAYFLAPHGVINFSVESFDKTETKIDRMLTRMGFAPGPAAAKAG